MSSPFPRPQARHGRLVQEFSRRCPRLRLKAISLAVYLGCAALTIASPHGDVQAQVTQRAYDIPAGSLASSLNRFAQQSGVSIAVDDSHLVGMKSAALKGRYSIEDGFSELLKDSGYGIGKTAAGYVLVPSEKSVAATTTVAAAEDKELPEVQVRARREANGTTEGTGSYTNRITSIASKTDQSFREIPQSVSVITRQLMDDKVVVDVEQALTLTPGVIVADNSGRYYSRGFQITSMQIDGGAPMALGSYTYQPQQDMAFYDRVEVMRGASGLLGGVGDPGGIINLVRKKPLAHRQIDVSQSFGSWGNRRTEIDATGPLGFDGHLRGRAVLAYQDSGSYFDYISQEKPSFYGVMEADLTRDTLLTIGATYGKVRQKGDYGGLPRFSDGRALGLARNTAFSNPWAYFNYENSEVFLQLEQRFDNQWKIKLNASHERNRQDRRWSTLSGAVDPQTLTGPVWRGGVLDSSNVQDIVDLNVGGPFSLLGRTHELLLGVDWQRVRSHWQNLSFADSGLVGGNVFDMQPWNPAFDQYNLSLSERYGPWGQEQLGGYGVLRLHPTDRLHLIGGARLSQYKFEQTMSDIIDTSGSTRPWSAKSFKQGAKLTPYGGIIYDLSSQWSGYLSYSSIYKPQALSLAGPMPGTPLAPIKGNSYEAGVKGELMDGKLNATFSVFNVERTGTAVLDERYAENDSLWGASCCYLPQGKVTSRGFDVEVGGEIARGWQLAAGYTFNQTRDETEKTIFSSITPKHLFKVSTSFNLPGEWSKWRVGGSGRIQSTQFVSGTITAADGSSQPYNFTQGGYAIWDLMAQYQIDPQWLLSANLNNVLNKEYYQTVGTIYNGNMQGLPRNATVTLRRRL